MKSRPSRLTLAALTVLFFSGATGRGLLQILRTLASGLKAALKLIDPSKVLSVISGLLFVRQRLAHVVLLGALAYWSTSYVDYGYFYTMISLKLSGVDISNCDNLPFETMIKIAACIE